MKNIEKRQYRAIGHKLKPIVTVGGSGLSETVIAEVDRALNDHELIKIKCAGMDRDSKAEIISDLCGELNAEAVQVIGNTALLLRRSKKPNPKLSNLIRAALA
ncbi:MAG: ribosome assembly RNA-binding protein YhbY [Aequoribacter sp.]|jgi:RNA-binding protein|uniref:RNA binding protein n=1 Tax=Aequoribacter fuscus TaxID=2518989 RepID=F3KYZ6_9GAMM|nr:ribosome assembly RNA-binding protein YhbY [Aequoribacter fuscus]EGG30713.1 RNA binding protein [Aequoribacter fuscus]